MKITDLLPSDLGPLQFHRLNGSLSRDSVFQVHAAGSTIAELAPITVDEAAIAVPRPCCSDSAGLWSLDLVLGEARALETHVLCLASAADGQPEGLTGELAAWATLTVLWAASSWVPREG